MPVNLLVVWNKKISKKKSDCKACLIKSYNWWCDLKDSACMTQQKSQYCLSEIKTLHWKFLTLTLNFTKPFTAIVHATQVAIYQQHTQKNNNSKNIITFQISLENCLKLLISTITTKNQSTIDKFLYFFFSLRKETRNI